MGKNNSFLLIGGIILIGILFKDKIFGNPSTLAIPATATNPYNQQGTNLGWIGGAASGIADLIGGLSDLFGKKGPTAPATIDNSPSDYSGTYQGY